MTFIVVELGGNWHGDPIILERMVRRCKWADIDAVKFQALSEELIERHPELDWYKHASITQDNIHAVDKICKSLGMEWFVTPCYTSAVKWLNPYVKQWKIRHADNTKTDIINECLKTDKPIYISCSRLDEIPIQHKNIIPIYCISLYPIPDFGDINFDMMKILKGWSNHYKGLDACLKALKYNIDYLEFHLTDNISEHSIDNRVSLTYSQMDILMYYKKLSEKETF